MSALAQVTDRIGSFHLLEMSRNSVEEVKTNLPPLLDYILGTGPNIGVSDTVFLSVLGDGVTGRDKEGTELQRNGRVLFA